MSPRRTRTPNAEPEFGLSPTDPAMEGLRSRLAAASKEDLIALLERLASHSEEMATRIDYVTRPSAATATL